jgi:hypothetical protein
MANSIFEATGDGNATDFTIPYNYLEANDVTAFVGGVSTSFTFPSSNIVRISPAPAIGTDIRIVRNTDIAALNVTYSDGGALTADQLNNSNTQLLFGVQEAIDTANEAMILDNDGKFQGQVSGTNRVIKNVADPVDNTDAVNKQFISTNLPNINTVAGISTEVTTVAGIASDVTAVVADQADIGTVATSITNVDLVGTNITSVNTNATNITDIQNASANATTATTQAGLASGFADEAEAWAQKIDGEAQAGDGYSAKAWATGGTGVTSSSGAGAAQEWATKASNSTVDGTELSAKAYAVGDMNRGSAGSHSAKDWATYYSGLNTVDGTHKSARAYAIDAANAVADFNQVYYGTYANDTDAETAHTNAGNTVAAGDLYFSTSTNAVRYYNGTSWTDIAAVNTSNFATAGFSIAMSIAL